jgi:hypothetical protein
MLPAERITNSNQYLIWLVIFILVTTLAYQLFYTLLYFLEPESLKIYKANELEWPWKQNPKAFKKNIWKYIIRHVIL